MNKYFISISVSKLLKKMNEIKQVSQKEQKMLVSNGKEQKIQ